MQGTNRHDPQPDRGNGPPEGMGRPDNPGRPVPGTSFVQPRLRYRYAEGVGECRDAYPGLLAIPQE